jgi:hypothetical protein
VDGLTVASETPVDGFEAKTILARMIRANFTDR